jgi:hypothetical protein
MKAHHSLKLAARQLFPLREFKETFGHFVIGLEDKNKCFRGLIDLTNGLEAETLRHYPGPRESARRRHGTIRACSMLLRAPVACLGWPSFP